MGAPAMDSFFHEIRTFPRTPDDLDQLEGVLRERVRKAEGIPPSISGPKFTDPRVQRLSDAIDQLEDHTRQVEANGAAARERVRSATKAHERDLRALRPFTWPCGGEGEPYCNELMECLACIAAECLAERLDEMEDELATSVRADREQNDG